MLKWHTGDGKGSDRILQGAHQKTIILPVQFTRFDLKKRIKFSHQFLLYYMSHRQYKF